MAERKPTKVKPKPRKAKPKLPETTGMAVYVCCLCRKVRLSPANMIEARFCSGNGEGHRVQMMTRVDAQVTPDAFGLLRPVMEE